MYGFFKGAISRRFDGVRHKPIQFQLNFIIGTLIFFTVIIIAFVTYTLLVDFLNENFEYSQVTILNETSEKINSRLKAVERTIQMITSDYRLQNYLDDSREVADSDIYEYFNDCIVLNKYKVERDGITYVDDLIDDIIFLNPKRDFVSRRYSIDISNVNKLKDTPVFRSAFEEKGKLLWTDVFYN